MSASTGSETITFTRLHHPAWLRLLRMGWMVIALLATGMFLVNLPAEFVIFRDEPHWAVGFQPVLEQVNLSRDFFAAYITAIDLIVVLPAIALAAVVFRQRPDDWLALLVSITMILYAVSLTLAFYLASPFLSSFLQNQGIALILWIVCVFPDGRWTPAPTKWLVPLLFLVDVVLLLAGVDTSIALYLIGLPLGIIALLMRYRRTIATPVQHQQVRWLMWGLIVGIFASTLHTLIPTLVPELRSVGWNDPVYSVPSLVVFLITNTIRLSSSLVFVTVIGLSVIRYRLWDLDLTINRSLVYGLVTGLLAIVFILIVILIRALAGQEQSGVAFAAALVGAGALFNPARKQIQHLIDRRFYGFRFDLNELAAAQQSPEVKNPGLLTGRTLGGYQVLGVLGKGGMGEVYQGTGAGKTVALKILPAELAAQADFRRRFEREGTMLAQLDHPHIVRFYEAGENDGVAFIALEFVEGQELSEVIRARGQMPLAEVAGLIQDCAAALDYAHERGLVHRDIKPSNIMVRNPTPVPCPHAGRDTPPPTPVSSRQGLPRFAGRGDMEAVIMDFGVAKIREGATVLTGTGAIGTIDYMAPEQILAAKEVDARADIYALGVVVYEMLTGTRPFQGNPGQVLFAHLQQPPPDVRTLRADIPSSVAHAIEQAMAKDPAERFASAGAFAAALSTSMD